MSENPYQPPQPTTGAAQPQKRARSIVRRFPMTTIALSIATVVGSLAAAKEAWTQIELAQNGVVVTSWSILDGLSFPGVLFLYVVGTITNSFVLAGIAFAVGMALAYGSVGLVIDLAKRFLLTAE